MPHAPPHTTDLKGQWQGGVLLLCQDTAINGSCPPESPGVTSRLCSKVCAVFKPQQRQHSWTLPSEGTSISSSVTLPLLPNSYQATPYLKFYKGFILVISSFWIAPYSLLAFHLDLLLVLSRRIWRLKDSEKTNNLNSKMRSIFDWCSKPKFHENILFLHGLHFIRQIPQRQEVFHWLPCPSWKRDGD